MVTGEVSLEAVVVLRVEVSGTNFALTRRPLQVAHQGQASIHTKDSACEQCIHATIKDFGQGSLRLPIVSRGCNNMCDICDAPNNINSGGVISIWWRESPSSWFTGTTQTNHQFGMEALLFNVRANHRCVSFKRLSLCRNIPPGR